MHEAVPPILNQEMVDITTKSEETIIIPCVAYASPSPKYR